MHLAGSEAKSQNSYDIFRKDPTGNPIWIEAVPGFEAARQRLFFLSSQSDGEYLLFDPSSHAFIDVKTKAQSA